MTGLKTRKEKFVFCLETGIAGACIATACFYVSGASFAVLFADRMTANALMTAWKLWLEFFLLSGLASAGYAYVIVAFWKEPKGEGDKPKDEILEEEGKEV